MGNRYSLATSTVSEQQKSIKQEQEKELNEQRASGCLKVLDPVKSIVLSYAASTRRDMRHCRKAFNLQSKETYHLVWNTIFGKHLRSDLKVGHAVKVYICRSVCDTKEEQKMHSFMQAFERSDLTMMNYFSERDTLSTKDLQTYLSQLLQLLKPHNDKSFLSVKWLAETGKITAQDAALYYKKFYTSELEWEQGKQIFGDEAVPSEWPNPAFTY